MPLNPLEYICPRCGQTVNEWSTHDCDADRRRNQSFMDVLYKILLFLLFLALIVLAVKAAG